MATATNTQLGEIILAGDLAGNGGAQVGTSPQLKTIPGLVAGSYSIPTITVDSKGRVTAIASGGADLSTLLPYATATKAGLISVGDNLYIAGAAEAGYWTVNFGGTLLDGTATGLSNQACAQYSFTLVVDNSAPQQILINGAAAQTVNNLVAALNAKMTGAVAGLINGNIVIVSATSGKDSSVQLTNISLFACVTNFVNNGTATPGNGTCELYAKRASLLDYGVVKVGNGITVTDGVISADTSVLPTATTTSLGGVIVPTAGGLVIDAAGNLSVPTATSSSKGVVQVGTGLLVSAGVVSVDPSTLPTATATVKGAVKVGSGLTVSAGTLSVDPNSITLPVATSSVAGAVQVGSGLSVAAGVVSVDAANINLPNATASTKGGVRVGANLSVAAGVVSANVATASTLGTVQVGTGLTVASGVISVAPATTSVIGGVKIGSGLNVTADGTVSAAVIPDATTTTKGIVQIGAGLQVGSGIVSIPTASTSNLGVVQVGTGLLVTAGVLSVATASTTVRGAVKIGSGLAVTADGTVSLAGTPNASTSVKGVVKIGSNINVTDGVISLPTADASTFGLVRPGTNIINTNGVMSVPLANGTTAGLVTSTAGSPVVITDGVISLDATVVRNNTNNVFAAVQSNAIKDAGSTIASTVNIAANTGNIFKFTTTAGATAVTMTSSAGIAGARTTVLVNHGSANSALTFPSGWTIKGYTAPISGALRATIDGVWISTTEFVGTYTRNQG